MTKQNPKSLRSVTAEDLLNRTFRPRFDVLSPWLRSEESAVLWAASGVGKTMLSLSIALAVAGGGRVGPWNAPKPLKVLYVDGEMNLQDVRDRVELLVGTDGILGTPEEQSQALSNLTITARQDQTVGKAFYDLTNLDSQNCLLDRVRRGKINLLVLDNLTTLTDDLEDENASVAFKKVQDFFLNLKRLGVATILVHHSNKGGKQMRGSSALETTFEVIIGLKKPSIARPGQASFVLEFGKYRAQGDHSLDTQTWTLDGGRWVTSAHLPDDPAENPFFKALKSGRYVSHAEIGRALGVNRSTALRRVNAICAMGHLSRAEVNELFRRAKDLRELDETPDDDLEEEELEDHLW
ncbi:AAA family ATPase [Wenxinia marina]|uniref:AAA domain protein n=1 Tax=Wenxinia marina DSM 24838 TaxID=1123501 RepID=A0A0D0QDW4_9RHOB|nr:AAA family ATPase [Wenxinia marina]KIQ69193.1 AAA domain protein [Wenxinia marina DSM 24838]GGL71070.1 hypothetical protein GCM10011392_27010 [Wenxinia marina]